jgi:phosphoribosylformylglycinamidine synthase
MKLFHSKVSKKLTCRLLSSNKDVIQKLSSIPSIPSIPLRLVRLYKNGKVNNNDLAKLKHNLNEISQNKVSNLYYEECFNIKLKNNILFNTEDAEKIVWLLKETYDDDISLQSLLPRSFQSDYHCRVIEVGPRRACSTPYSTNAVSISKSLGMSTDISQISSVEKSRRYHIISQEMLTEDDIRLLETMLYDKMTEEIYQSIDDDCVNEPSIMNSKDDTLIIPLIENGRHELEVINKKMGLAFDEWDIDYYTDLFVNVLKRNPTNVELFDIAQSNSEHSRHWFFRGRLIIDNMEMDSSLMDIVQEPLRKNTNNSLIAFNDNSSAIRGFVVRPLRPEDTSKPSSLNPTPRYLNLLLTAETHNFPCAIAPFPGAETGVGGRMRDTHATGKGSLMGAGTAGYCVGNLNIESHPLWFESEIANKSSFEYPAKLASPLRILIEASNGASDYGNKFGEPLITGFTRTFGQKLSSEERREWLKPIMFSGGIGQIEHHHIKKDDGEVGMLVVKIGGPAYRIGLGGGAASSMASGDDATSHSDLDFNAVQRGDAQMAQKLWRVVRACVEMGEYNPIVQIHDQGAGGNCNVIKEIIYPLGAKININNIILGDETLTTLEIWGAEYQENDCILIRQNDEELLNKICERERCLMQVVGKIDGSGKVRLIPKNVSELPFDTMNYVVDLNLEHILGSMPNKKFTVSSKDRQRQKTSLEPFKLPVGTTIKSALENVLKMPSVCSKRFLTTKVDRHVSGLIAQQQCVGPLQIPISDYGLMAQTHQDLSGIATSIGEQPIKGLIDPSAMARLALTEAITNICWVVTTSKGLEDIKSSVNWMYAAKLKSEGAIMYEAALSLKDAMIELGCACDGGKDSLSMAVSTSTETILAPGNLVVSAYVGVPNITKKITPDIKSTLESFLLHIDLANVAGCRRIGGSAFAQAYNQLGNRCPDVNMGVVKRFFPTIQKLIETKKILSGHDVSDGGLITTVLEMAFAGNCGVTLNIPLPNNASQDEIAPYKALFAEESGVVIEVSFGNLHSVLNDFNSANVPCIVLGNTTQENIINISVGNTCIISETTQHLRDVWESTSFEIEKLQANPDTVKQEQKGLQHRKKPVWSLSFTPEFTPRSILISNSYDELKKNKVMVAIVREEGSNGDREMAAAIYAAGMDPWDVTMSDLISNRINLSQFKGVVFVGGFSYADVFDSAKGWGAAIKHNSDLSKQFTDFYNRDDTFSLGICNGCQLMSLLGFVPSYIKDEYKQPRFIKNASNRFESRWVNVRILEGHNNIWLKDMENSVMGVWVAHGEGKAYFPDEDNKYTILNNNLAPIRYTDDNGLVTEDYPSNPNGSPYGIAAISSINGRHLAMMPHPERCFMTWQMPYYPEELISSQALKIDGPSPWLKLFQNARQWVDNFQ